MSQTISTKKTRLCLFPGDIVEVRSVAEIVATLDANGTVDKLPFMPEMLAFCGRQFRVSRQAFKTCVDDGDMRQLNDTVLLEEVRCSGANHGSCDRGCLMFWKTAWLKRPGESASNQTSFGLLDERQLQALAERDGKIFCQSSEIVNASKPLPWWDAKQYVWDLKYNRTSITQFAQSLFIAVYNKVAFKLKFPSWRSVTGPSEGSNGFQPLDLRPGEYVRVRPLSEIQITLDGEGKNHNLLFAPAMVNYCGQIMKVRDRVENIVLEATSNQRKIKHTVLLEGATCDGICHRLCPRQSLLFWRECWLERLTQPGVAGATN